MSNLNLASEVDEVSRGPKLFTPSFVLAFSILILVLLLWGGLIAGQKYLSGKMAAAQIKYNNEYQKFLAGNAKKVADFQNRTSVASGLLKSRPNIDAYLSAMERDIVPPVYLTSFKFDDTQNTLTVEGVADNYNTVAKQILSFKNDKLFSSVIIGNSDLTTQTSMQSNANGQGGTTTSQPRVDFSIILSVKN